MENTFFEAVNKSGPVSNSKISEKASSSSTLTDEPRELEMENAFFEAVNQAAESKISDPGHNNSSDTITAPPSENSDPNAAKPVEGTDVVSAAVIAASLSAVAVTANPLFAAGVAFGPVIRESIASAKSRMKKPPNSIAKSMAKPPKKTISKEESSSVQEVGTNGDDGESKTN